MPRSPTPSKQESRDERKPPDPRVAKPIDRTGAQPLGDFRPGMGLVTKLVLNGLVTVLCAVMVAGTTIAASFAFSGALDELNAVGDAVVEAANSAGSIPRSCCRRKKQRWRTQPRP